VDERGGQPENRREAETLELAHELILYSGANTELKNRVSQPISLALLMTPLPE
jgi:hypothetical protein